MSFEDTTRKMADEVAQIANSVRVTCEFANKRPWPMGEAKILGQLEELARAVEKLALCAARRFPGNADEAAPTGACSTCTTRGDRGEAWSMKVFVVRVCCGDYSDRSEWVDSVWTSTALAKARAEELGGPKGRRLKPDDYDDTHANVEELTLDKRGEET